MAASKTKEERPEVPYFSDLGAALADDAANELVGNGHLLRLLRRARRSAALLLAARTQLTAGQRRQRCPKQDKKQNKTQSTKHPLKEDTHTHTHSRGQICGRATKTWSVLDWSNFLFKAYGTNEGSANEKGRISKERERESPRSAMAKEPGAPSDWSNRYVIFPDRAAHQSATVFVEERNGRKNAFLD